MDYANYREPVLARSPPERSGWGRDDERPGKDRERDTFYRGRSPGFDRQRNPRKRSRSPLNVDRYEPRGPPQDYDRARDRDDRRRVSPGPANIDRYVPGHESSPSSVAVNPLTDPAKMPFQVGFSYFGEWWRANEKVKDEKERQRTGRRRDPDRVRGQKETLEEREKEKAKIQAAYDAYKEELQSKMARAFVQEHKNEQWFQERYIPSIREPFRAQLNEFRRGNYSQWETDLDAGTFDEFSLEGIPKSDSNGAGGVVEKEEGEMSASNEVLGVGDLLPMKGSDLRDENAFQPTLLIKTIAPHVSRENLEIFCKEHLGEDEGGFKWLSLSDPNPSKRYHRIGWVMLHPAADADRPDLKAEEGEADIALPSTAEKALEAINGQPVKDEVRGDFTCHVGVHNPPAQPRKKALWDLFSAPERIEKDLDLATRLINKYEQDFGSDFSAVLKIEERVEDLRNQGRLVPAEPQTKKVRSVNLDEAAEDGEEMELEDEEEGVVDEEVDDEDLIIKKKQLDLMVEYLRRVFNFCFFCVFESDSIHELTRKCPGGHLRRPRNTLSTAAKNAARASALGESFPGKKRNDDEGPGSPEEDKKSRTGTSKAEQQLQRAFNWVKTFEDKLLQILEPENIDVRKLGGKPVEEAIAEELTKFVKQEDEHKFRCRIPECTKLFKEEHFWKKHVEKRHGEWLDSLRKDFELINTYVLDPAHIAPSRSDAGSNGHFPPTNGHMPAGTPRGFNLSNFNMQGMPNMPGFNGIPQFFNGSPAGFEERGPGPVRRGGRQNVRSGPYERRPRDQRWSNDMGRTSPTRRSTPTAGPREAVQGRSLKSYEDLDAVTGGGGSELNY